MLHIAINLSYILFFNKRKLVYYFLNKRKLKNKLAKPNFKCLAYYTKILQLEKKEKKSYNFNSIFKSLITQWLTHSSIYNKNIYDSNFHTPITKL